MRAAARLALSMALLCTLAACSWNSTEEPRLGVEWAPGQRGYGEIEPDEIFNGGVPTGHVFDVEWESWGDDQAIAHGTGYHEQPGCGSACALARPATVVAFDLGECDGHRAYRQVRWFLVEEGESVDLGGDPWYDICTPYEE